ncbi:flagellar biosynthesis protein FliQ [Nevskia sp.]|uniref:flagellar biosynthesis protein FliQ n=1 Tax=Nevskia sp. TaxID=1929292 RepID=UPI0025D324E9|nr:flagellar biosynthesis protein FliQ [Nevskia sp.]
MTPETVLTIGSQALQLVLMLAAPLLLTALAVGVLIGVFQAATQINEQTLSFIPKLLATAAVLVFTGPWMLRLLTEYTKRLYDSIPALIH